MVTQLEIIDTTVKVGLGAIISGVTTYFITKRAQRHEIQRSLISDKKELLRESALKLAKSSSMINHVVAEIFKLLQRQTVEKEDKLDELLKDLTSAFNEGKEARTLCYLMGDDTLGHLMFLQVSLMADLNMHYHTKRLDYDVAYVDANTDKRNENGMVILNHLSEAHTAIYLTHYQAGVRAPSGRLRLCVVASAFWALVSVISYLAGIWSYPSLLTSWLSTLYLWTNRPAVTDQGIELMQSYPTVDAWKLLALATLPVLFGWLLLYICPGSVRWIRNGFRHKS